MCGWLRSAPPLLREVEESAGERIDGQKAFAIGAREPRGMVGRVTPCAAQVGTVLIRLVAKTALKIARRLSARKSVLAQIKVTEGRKNPSSRPLRDSARFASANPALKCWAIFTAATGGLATNRISTVASDRPNGAHGVTRPTDAPAP